MNFRERRNLIGVQAYSLANPTTIPQTAGRQSRNNTKKRGSTFTSPNIQSKTRLLSLYRPVHRLQPKLQCRDWDLLGLPSKQERNSQPRSLIEEDFVGNKNEEVVTHTVAIAPGASGRVVTTYYEGPFSIPFNCKCDLMASVKMAPTQAFAVQDPSSSHAHDEMLKAVLKGAGFNERGSTIQDIIYDYDRCTYVNSGTMRGDSGLRSETIVTVTTGARPEIATVTGPDDDSD